jgi:hypothetical protein
MVKVIKKDKAKEKFKAWKQNLETEKRIKAQQELDKEKLERFKEKQRKEIYVTVKNGKLVAFTKDD